MDCGLAQGERARMQAPIQLLLIQSGNRIEESLPGKCPARGKVAHIRTLPGSLDSRGNRPSSDLEQLQGHVKDVRPHSIHTKLLQAFRVHLKISLRRVLVCE